MFVEPFHFMSVDKWDDLKKEFKSHWPRGITGFYALETLEKWLYFKLDYGFRVLCPFGESRSGIVVVLKDESDFIEILLECPQDDTSKLEEALKNTKLIDFNRPIVILFPHKRIVECLKRIAEDINMIVEWEHPMYLYILDKNTALYDVSLPQGFTFKLLSEDYTELADSTWPHRYPGSKKYFQLLIRSKSGYGLFKEEQLVSFGFVKEMGALGHIYTLEEHRRKGYGEMVTKLISNELLKAGKDVFSFCVGGNVQSCEMHNKLGFIELDNVLTVQLKPLVNYNK